MSKPKKILSILYKKRSHLQQHEAMPIMQKSLTPSHCIPRPLIKALHIQDNFKENEIKYYFKMLLPVANNHRKPNSIKLKSRTIRIEVHLNILQIVKRELSVMRHNIIISLRAVKKVRTES